SEERVVHLPKRRRCPRGGKRWPFGAWQAHDRRGPRCRVMRIDLTRVQLLLDDRDTRAHNVWRDGIAYHQKSVCEEIASGYCHLFLLWGRRDIMTSNGGKLTPDVTRVSLPKPEPHDAATSSTTSEVNHVAV